VAPALRTLFLDRIYTVKGLEAARYFYDAEVYSPPFGMDLHLKMIELERVEGGKKARAKGGKKVMTKRVRRTFEAATDQCGKDDVGVWLDFVAFECEHGKAGDVESVKNRAGSVLERKAAEKFVLECEMMSLK
jgi:hypothetical protein